ncbi:RPA1, partial [Symbiodinium sp. KB8]
MGDRRLEVYKVKMALIKAGLLPQALELDDDIHGLATSAGDESEATNKVEALLKRCMTDAKAATPGEFLHTHEREVWRETVRDLLMSIPRVCENCGAPAFTLRKDGHTKIFRSGASDQTYDKLEAGSHRLFSAVKTLEQLRSGSSEALDQLNVRSQVFLTAAEVEAHIALLWMKQPEVLSAIWGSYTKFFLHAIPVPANRFRPPAQLGDLTFEHPQNVYLAKILNFSKSLAETGSQLRAQRKNIEAEIADPSSLILR